MTTKTKEMLQGEIRYAIRLTQRTARLYRHLQTTGIFFSILGGSAALSAVAGGVPGWWWDIAGGFRGCLDCRSSGGQNRQK